MAYDPPELEIKDKTFGLVSPEAFELPTLSPLWTAVAYASFDTALTDKEKKKQVHMDGCVLVRLGMKSKFSQFLYFHPYSKASILTSDTQRDPT